MNLTYQIRVTSIDDAHDTNSVELSGSSSELNVGALVVVHGGLGAVMCNNIMSNDAEPTIQQRMTYSMA